MGIGFHIGSQGASQRNSLHSRKTATTTPTLTLTPTTTTTAAAAAAASTRRTTQRTTQSSSACPGSQSSLSRAEQYVGQSVGQSVGQLNTRHLYTYTGDVKGETETEAGAGAETETEVEVEIDKEEASAYVYVSALSQRLLQESQSLPAAVVPASVLGGRFTALGMGVSIEDESLNDSEAVDEFITETNTMELDMASIAAARGSEHYGPSQKPGQSVRLDTYTLWAHALHLGYFRPGHHTRKRLVLAQY